MTLSATGITLSLQGKNILRDVQFDALPGQVTAIVGPNGSGKTTLLRVMTGEEDAEGQILLNGHLVSRTNAAQLATIRGVLPQATRVAFPFKVSEVVRIGHHAGLYAAQPDVPQRALDAVGLDGFGHRFYQELSGGEQQRVQLARVLAQIWQPMRGGEACWLFLDEPVASLDIGHQLAIMHLARDFALRGGGVVVVMHDLNLTAMFADQVMVMQDGGSVCFGKPADVLTSTVLSRTYGCNIQANTLPPKKGPFVLPQAAALPAKGATHLGTARP